MVVAHCNNMAMVEVINSKDFDAPTENTVLHQGWMLPSWSPTASKLLEAGLADST